ncbi:Lrp/AsnC family transcriptional regulator [Sphingosinicella terrae]|uniref:Lrp/AsnC family transcriptional regulator n=1 Tax=Sphingosinicella terrae TaxID=2172047 RepID=UPI000E0CC64F|nr:Lrp/AsnC family transcriptional regulator [Sphingosinicella terrae]
MPQTEILDSVDRRILSALRLDGRITNQALAAKVGLSPSACLRRLRTLERSGIIQGYTAIIAGPGAGDGVTAIVHVTLERQTEEYLARFEKALRQHPDVREWHLMAGQYDYILRVQTPDMRAYESFHKEVLSRLPGVARITSSFAMRSSAGG